MPIFKIIFTSTFLSKLKRMTDSAIFNVIIGIAIVPIVITKSTVPYSVVDKTFVYNGIKTNKINLVARLPIVNIAVFF